MFLVMNQFIWNQVLTDVSDSNPILFLHVKVNMALSAFCSSLQAWTELWILLGQWWDGGRGNAGTEGEAGGDAAGQLGQKNPDRWQEKEERGQWAQTLHGMRWQSRSPGSTRGRWQIWYVFVWPPNTCLLKLCPYIFNFHKIKVNNTFVEYLVTGFQQARYRLAKEWIIPYFMNSCTDKGQATLSLGMDLNLDWMTLDDFQKHLNGEDEILSGPPLSPSKFLHSRQLTDFCRLGG